MKKFTEKTKKAKGCKIKGKRNFFHKNLILFAILVFTGFGFKAKAQSYWFVEANNFSGCDDYYVTALDGSGNLIFSFQAFSTNPPGPYTAGSCTTTAIASITVFRSGCSPTTITFTPVLGVFVYQSASTTCCSGNDVDIQENTQNTCSGSPTHHITININ